MECDVQKMADGCLAIGLLEARAWNVDFKVYENVAQFDSV